MFSPFSLHIYFLILLAICVFFAVKSWLFCFQPSDRPNLSTKILMAVFTSCLSLLLFMLISSSLKDGDTLVVKKSFISDDQEVTYNTGNHYFDLAPWNYTESHDLSKTRYEVIHNKNARIFVECSIPFSVAATTIELGGQLQSLTKCLDFTIQIFQQNDISGPELEQFVQGGYEGNIMVVHVSVSPIN